MYTKLTAFIVNVPSKMARSDPSTHRKVFIEDYACEIYPDYAEIPTTKSAAGGTAHTSNETPHHADASEDFVDKSEALKLTESMGNRTNSTSANSSAELAWHQIPSHDAGGEKGNEEWGSDNRTVDKPKDYFGTSIHWKEAEAHHDEAWRKSDEIDNHTVKHPTRQELVPMDAPPSDEIHALLNRILSLEAQIEGHKEEIYYLRVEQQYMESEHGNEHTDTYRIIEDHTNQINTLHTKIHDLHEKLLEQEENDMIGGRRMAD
jgi:hypothetical protein